MLSSLERYCSGDKDAIGSWLRNPSQETNITAANADTIIFWVFIVVSVLECEIYAKTICP